MIHLASKGIKSFSLSLVHKEKKIHYHDLFSWLSTVNVRIVFLKNCMKIFEWYVFVWVLCSRRGIIIINWMNCWCVAAAHLLKLNYTYEWNLHSGCPCDIYHIISLCFFAWFFFLVLLMLNLVRKQFS